jgi:hypothetical protein
MIGGEFYMLVSNYQIHNVLNAYSKQLSQGRKVYKHEVENRKQLSDQIQLSTEGKRRATIEKVAKDILNKISDVGADGHSEIDEQPLSGGNGQNTSETDDKKEAVFVFNVIDDLNRKKTTALSVKETNFLINRVEQLAGDAVEQDAAD